MNRPDLNILAKDKEVGSPRSNETPNITFKLPRLEGDCTIYLGQTIVTLIRLNLENDDVYSKSMQHGFKVELLNSIIEELDISIGNLERLRASYNEMVE